MITEDYCSYEVAKLLKEKGFDESCNSLYILLDSGDYRYTMSDFPYKNSCKYNVSSFARPTHQMAMKWLRCKGIYIEIDVLGKVNIKYGFTILKLNEGEIYSDDETYTTYEEAVEAALKYALEKI